MPLLCRTIDGLTKNDIPQEEGRTAAARRCCGQCIRYGGCCRNRWRWLVHAGAGGLKLWRWICAHGRGGRWRRAPDIWKARKEAGLVLPLNHQAFMSSYKAKSHQHSRNEFGHSRHCHQVCGCPGMQMRLLISRAAFLRGCYLGPVGKRVLF
jgi:hypothetical protein